MSQIDTVLKVYAESGLRTTADWTTRGRAIQSGATPRASADYHGTPHPLFSQDQTSPRPSSRSSPR
jgi:hypothetical protein